MPGTPNRNQNTKRISRLLSKSGLFVAATVLFLPITLFAQQGTLTDDSYYPHPKKGDAQVLTIDGSRAVAEGRRYAMFGRPFGSIQKESSQ